MAAYLYLMCFIPVISALLISLEYKFSTLSKYRILSISLPFVSLLMGLALLIYFALSPVHEWLLPNTIIIPESLQLEANMIYSLFAVIYLFFSIISLLKAFHQKPRLKIFQLLMIPAALVLILTNSVIVLFINSVIFTILQTAYFSDKKDPQSSSVWLTALLGELLLFAAVLVLLSETDFNILYSILILLYLAIKSGLAPFGFRAKNHFSLMPSDFFLAQTGNLIITVIIALKLGNIYSGGQETEIIIGSILLLPSLLSLIYQQKIQDTISHIIACQAGIILIMIFSGYYNVAIQYFISTIIGMTLLNNALYLPSEKTEGLFTIPKRITMISGILISIGIIPSAGFPALTKFLPSLILAAPNNLFLILPAGLIPVSLLIIAYKLFSIFFKEFKSTATVQKQNEPPVLNIIIFILLTLSGIYIFYQKPFYNPFNSVSRIQEYFGHNAAVMPFPLIQYLITGSLFAGLIFIMAGVAWYISFKGQRVTLENLPNNKFARFFYHDLYFNKIMDKVAENLRYTARQIIIIEDKIPGYLIFLSDKIILVLKSIYSTCHNFGKKIQTYLNKIKLNSTFTQELKFEQIVSFIIVLFILVLLITIL